MLEGKCVEKKNSMKNIRMRRYGPKSIERKNYFIKDHVS